jgi:hypothetical protein
MIVECKQCQAVVNAEAVTGYNYVYEDENTRSRVNAVYELCLCPRCQSPFLIDQDNVYGVRVLYPPQDNRINPNLPALLKSAYYEAVSCFKAKAYTATAIMCRKTLEGICAEHGIKGNNLVKSLKELKDNGIIESRLYEWADALRISGNEAAHDVRVTISPEDARDILEFTNALLEYIFTFRDRFEQFKERRAKREATNRGSVVSTNPPSS